MSRIWNNRRTILTTLWLIKTKGINMKKPINSSKESTEQKYEKPTDAEIRAAQKEIQKHFNKFKTKFKVKPKSELVAIIWEQGMEFKKLQDIAQELYEENKTLKEDQNDQENAKDPK